MSNRPLSSRFSTASDDEIEVYRAVKHPRSQEMSEVENWFPESVSRLLGVDDLNILTLDEATPESVEQDIVNSEGIGLRVVFDTKAMTDDGVEKRFLLVCITTKESIFVIRPTVPSDVCFLRRQLKRQDMEQRKVYVWDGTIAGDYLYRYMNIRLYDQTDIKSFDLNLTIDGHYLDNNVNESNFLTASYVRNIIKPQKKTFYELVEEWLSIEPSALKCSREELSEISKFPFNIRARNAIKKRCALVRQLGISMMNLYDSRRRRPLDLIYGMANRSDAELEAFERSSFNYSDLM